MSRHPTDTPAPSPAEFVAAVGVPCLPTHAYETHRRDVEQVIDHPLPAIGCRWPTTEMLAPAQRAVRGQYLVKVEAKTAIEGRKRNLPNMVDAVDRAQIERHFGDHVGLRTRGAGIVPKRAYAAVDHLTHVGQRRSLGVLAVDGDHHIHIATPLQHALRQIVAKCLDLDFEQAGANRRL